MRTILMMLLAAGIAAAAGIDGKWSAEMAAGKNGQKVSVLLTLKSDGSVLTGNVAPAQGKKARGLALQDGKVNGDAFSFTTVQHGKKGERKVTWRGTVRGDEITGTRTREGARRAQPFTARRAG